MIVTRETIVADARRWIGTPFEHQGRQCGVRGDCIAMVEEIALKNGIIDKPFKVDYNRDPDGKRVLSALRDHTDRLRTIKLREPGDIAFIRWNKEPQHLGIVTPDDRIIHGFSLVGKYVENIIAGPILAGLCSVWRIRGIQ